MNLPGIQVLACVVSLAMLYVTYTAFRKHQFGRGSLALWGAVWLLPAVASVFPGLFAPLATTLRLARLMDLVIVVGMFVLGGITFYMYLGVSRMQSQLEALVRERALDRAAPEIRAANAAAPDPPARVGETGATWEDPGASAGPTRISRS